MSPALNRITIYAKDMAKTSAFYQTYFDYQLAPHQTDGLIELISSHGGAIIQIHQAAKSVKLGQVGVKLVFDVQDVEAFKKKSAKLGLAFGATHAAEGYSFANAKDPDKNSVSVSSRAYRKRT